MVVGGGCCWRRWLVFSVGWWWLVVSGGLATLTSQYIYIYILYVRNWHCTQRMLEV